MKELELKKKQSALRELDPSGNFHVGVSITKFAGGAYNETWRVHGDIEAEGSSWERVLETFKEKLVLRASARAMHDDLVDALRPHYLRDSKAFETALGSIAANVANRYGYFMFVEDKHQ